MMAFLPFEVMGNAESADNISMKLLVLFSIFMLGLFFKSQSYADNSDCYKPAVNLKPITGLARALQFDRKGCLVEEVLTRRMQNEEKKNPGGVSEEQARRVQREVNAEACVCLTQKGVFQKNRYRNLGLGSKNSWMDDLVWKRMGDHFKGRVYEHFNKMLQLDVLLSRGDVNENYMMFAPKCRIKAVTEQISAMKGKKGNGYNCSNTKLFDKRLKLILGTDNLSEFEKTMEQNLRKVVENKIKKGSDQCLTYKSYLSSRSPSPLRYEILDIIKKVKDKHPEGSQELKNALGQVQQYYYNNYAKVKPGTSNNPLYNEQYLKTILGNDALNSDWRKQQGQELQDLYTGHRKTHKRNMRELQGDPFLKSLLEDPDFFIDFASSSEPELAFHHSKNIQKVFEAQNKECAQISSPEFIGRMFCEEAMPPLDMHLIVNDISPEAALNTSGENYFDSKINEYMTARFLCYEKRHLFKKNRWKRKKQDFENDGLIHEVLSPKKRLVSDLETLALKGSGDPRLQSQETEFEKLNKEMCPLLPKECQGSDMTSPNCNNIEAVLGTKQSMAYVNAQLDSMQIAGEGLSDQEKELINAEIERLLERYEGENFSLADDLEGEFPNGKILSLKDKIKEALLESYAKVIEKRTGKSIDRPIDPYSNAFRENVDSSNFYQQLYGQVDKLIQGHTLSEGRQRIVNNQRVAAVIGHYEEEIKTFYANLEGDQKQLITDSSQISREMLDSFFESKETSLEEVQVKLREAAPSGSGLARLFNDEKINPVVTNETGAAGSNFFTDYFLAASGEQEQNLTNFRDGIDPSTQTNLTSRGWAPTVGPSLPGANGQLSTEQGIPYTRGINSDNPIPTIVDNNRNSDTPGILGRQGATIPTTPIDIAASALPQQVPLRSESINPIEQTSSFPTSSTNTPLVAPTVKNNTSISSLASRPRRKQSGTNNSRNNNNSNLDSVGQFDRSPSSLSSDRENSESSLNDLSDQVSRARDRRKGLEVANQTQARLNDMDQRAMTANSRQAPQRVSPYQDYRSPAGGNRINPYTSNQGAGRLPSDIEGRVATGSKRNGKTDKGSSKANGAGGSASAKKAAEATGQLTANGAQASSPGVPAIPGFEGQSISNCAIPTLIYTMQCYLPKKVFDTWSYIDEFSTDEEIAKNRENPSEIVSQLGLEGKAFVVIQDIPKNKKSKNQEDQVLVITYDYFPEMLEDVDKMGDEKFRNDLISEILANRWNFLEMRNYAKNTKILEQTVYNKSDFLQLAEERKLKPMISSVAEELYENVAKMNLRIQKENKTKLKALRSEIASKR